MVATSLLLRPIGLVPLLLLLERIDNVIRDSNILDLCSRQSAMPHCASTLVAVVECLRTPRTHVVAPHICLLQPEELVALGAGLYDLLHDEVHPCVARQKMAVQCVAIFELDEHWVAYGGIEKSQRQLLRALLVACYVSLTLASMCTGASPYHFNS